MMNGIPDDFDDMTPEQRFNAIGCHTEKLFKNWLARGTGHDIVRSLQSHDFAYDEIETFLRYAYLAGRATGINDCSQAAMRAVDAAFQEYKEKYGLAR